LNINTTNTLEFNKIKETLKNYAISESGKGLLDKLEPSVDIKNIRKSLSETTECRAIVDITSSIPLSGMTSLNNIMLKLKNGSILLPEELESLRQFLVDGRKLKRFMKDKEYCAPCVSIYILSFADLQDIAEEIDKCIQHGRVDDRASNALFKLRKKIAILEDRINSKIQSFIKNSANRSLIQDNIVSMRGGRYVVPIKSEYKRNFDGCVLDSSQSGSTVFIEPPEVKKAQDELNICHIEEENEVYRILSSLTQMISEVQAELSINMETMAYYDFLFAKAKYSKSIDGRSAEINNKNYIDIKGGRHPLLGKSAVPLDFTIGDDYRCLVITGPNTGGKTVTLKTVGLLTMMVQSGLHVPVEEGSEFAVFADILTDIGDGQSIEQNLSTFSSHIKNIIDIIKCSDPYTLVILDEVGAGTDPGEGMGIAASVLEEIYKKGSVLLATTHYSEIKEIAEKHEGFKNGCMGFDITTLKPLYKLTIGKAGESNAFLIALRLGMDKGIIEKAHEITYKEHKDYTDYSEENIHGTIKKAEIVKSHEEQLEKAKIARKLEAVSEVQDKTSSFKIGDCVYISSMGRTGIVCEAENSKGEIGVMVMKKKLKINQKRLSLYVDGSELYPEDYDFDIVFKSKDYRKKNKIMNKKHVEGMKIEEVTSHEI
jgi:DNA mismatch repair protein MutS2